MSAYPKYTSVGCYPLLYLTDENEVLCDECAKEEAEETGVEIVGYVNWETPTNCECGEEIECAYPDED